jgi:DNA-binding Lrp family transcriptional regulator
MSYCIECGDEAEVCFCDYEKKPMDEYIEALRVHRPKVLLQKACAGEIILSSAYVLINCDLGAEEKVITELKSVGRVKEMHGVFGAYDIIAKVEAPSSEMVRDIITSRIRRIDRIRSTLTLMGIEGQE